MCVCVSHTAADLTNVGMSLWVELCVCVCVTLQLTSIDVDLIFTKSKPKGARRMSFDQFLEALSMLADKKVCSVCVCAFLPTRPPVHTLLTRSRACACAPRTVHAWGPGEHCVCVCVYRVRPSRPWYARSSSQVDPSHTPPSLSPHACTTTRYVHVCVCL